MAKLHHSTLKYAVGKYSTLQSEGKSEQDIKAAIAGDEKAFDKEAVEEIYAAIVKGASTDPEGEGEQSDPKAKDPDTGTDPNTGASQDNSQKEAKYKVIHRFADIKDFSTQYEVGEDVSHFDSDRLEMLVNKKLVKKFFE